MDVIAVAAPSECCRSLIHAILTVIQFALQQHDV